MNKREIRTIETSELRALPGDGNTLTGYIAVFNSMSDDLGGFREVLAPGCFSSSLGSGRAIRALINHNSDACIGNTASGTLRLKQDSKGLAFECELPDTTAARDLKVSIERRDTTGCSFGFRCLDDDWKNVDGVTIRTIKDLELYEVSAGVVFPAYDATSSQLRSLFPDGPPVNPLIETRDAEDDAEDRDSCQCDCAECEAGDCADCSDPDCDDSICADAEERSVHNEDENRRLRIRLSFACDSK
jgi:hypothetical protein